MVGIMNVNIIINICRLLVEIAFLRKYENGVNTNLQN